MSQTNLKDAVGHGLKANAIVSGYQFLPSDTNGFSGGNTTVFPAGSDLGILYASYATDEAIGHPSLDFIQTYDEYYNDYFIPFGEYLFTLYDGSRLTAYGTNSGVKPGPDPTKDEPGGGDDNGGSNDPGTGGDNTGNGNPGSGGSGSGGNHNSPGGGDSKGGGLLGLGDFNLFGFKIPWAFVIAGALFIYETRKSKSDAN